MKNSIISFLLVTAVFLSQTSRVQARPANPDDAETETEVYNRSIKVKKDGTYTETIETKIKVLKEGAKPSVSSQQLFYNASNSTLKVLEAKTISPKGEFPVAEDKIQDKPLASSPFGFDQNNQVLIAFPQVELNSEVYLKYEVQTKEPAIPGFYSGSIVFGWGSRWIDSSVEIESELPLEFAVFDNDHNLEIKKEKLGKKDLLTVRLAKKPIFKWFLDEPRAVLNPKLLPWVTVSTQKKWSQVSQGMIKKYEAVLKQPLPDLFKEIAAEAKKKTTPTDRINTITSMLAERVNYMGDWRSIAGAYVPRDLKTIAETRLGDCKDFSAATTAILRSIGVTAHVAWTNRGEGSFEMPHMELPQLNFNHAIVRVKSENKILWIDPTNFASFSQGVFPDIADKRALVLDSKTPELAYIPALAPESSVWKVTKVVDPEAKNTAKIKGTLSLSGAFAIDYTGLNLRTSKEGSDLGIVRSLADESRVSEWKIDDYNLVSRIVSDLVFHFNFTEKHTQLKTTLGQAYLVSMGDQMSALLTKTTDRMTDLFIGRPATLQRETLVKGHSEKPNQASRCFVESPWADAHRQVLASLEGIQVIDSLKIKKSKIFNAELKSEQFQNFQEKLQDCLGEIAVIHTPEAETVSSTR